MTFQKPSELPKFAEQDIDNDVDGAPNKLAPSDDVKNKGMAFLQSAGRRGSTQVINWFNGLVYKWLGYLDEQREAHANTLTQHNSSIASNTSHSQATGNPHGTTKADVGLGNADNTSDADKPISAAQQAAFNAKADKTDTMVKLFNFQEETSSNYSTWGVKTLPDVATGNARKTGSYLFVMGSEKLDPVMCVLNLTRDGVGTWKHSLEVISGDATYLKTYYKEHINLSGRDIFDYKILFEFPDASYYEGAYIQMYHLAGEKGEFFGGDEAFEELTVGTGYTQVSHKKKFETVYAGRLVSTGNVVTYFGEPLAVNQYDPGDYGIQHDLGHTDYTVHLTPVPLSGNGNVLTYNIKSKAASSVFFELLNGETGNRIDYDVEFEIRAAV
jgi:hypothetical protein